MDDRPLSIRARKKVREEIQKVERERMMVLFQKRMELARLGAIASKENRIKDAMTAYMAYLEILEKTKNVPRGTIEPKHFDMSKDVAELLLLNGVFWDLAKIHDRAGGKKGSERLRYYLDRFVLFSKGMPFQKVSSELVRKYLVGDLPRHRKEFKEVHLSLGGNRCFVATALNEYSAEHTIPELREFRDRVLLESTLGRVFVDIYYSVGPTLAAGVTKLPVFIKIKMGLSLDRLAHFLASKF